MFIILILFIALFYIMCFNIIHIRELADKLIVFLLVKESQSTKTLLAFNPDPQHLSFVRETISYRFKRQKQTFN